MNQASRKSWLVPVLPAPASRAGCRRARCRRRASRASSGSSSPHSGRRRCGRAPAARAYTAPCRRRCGCAEMTCGKIGVAAIGERRIGGHEFERRDFRCAERDRGIRLELRSDAQPVGGADDGGRSQFQRQPHRHGVERFGERLRQRHRAVILALEIRRASSHAPRSARPRAPCRASCPCSSAVR